MVAKESQIKARISCLTESVSEIDAMLDCPDIILIKRMLNEIREKRVMGIKCLKKALA